MTQKWRLTVGVVAATLALTSCGGDTPEELAAAITSSASELDFLAEDEQTCAAGVIMTEIGFETITGAGHDSGSLGLDPGSITDVLDLAADRDAFDDDLSACVDESRIFRAQLESGLGDPLTCDTRFSRTDTIVQASLDAAIAGEDHTVEIDDTPERRDEFRECMTEADFGATFGIDPPEALALAIEPGLPEDFPIDPECASDALIEAFGAEALNDLGVTTNDPAVDIDDFDEDELVEAVMTCEPVLDVWSMTVDEPAFGPCIAERLADDERWLSARIRESLGAQNARFSVERGDRDATNDCVEERVATALGLDPETHEFTAPDFAHGLLEGVTTNFGDDALTRTHAEWTCASHWILNEVSLDDIIQIGSTPPEELTAADLDRVAALSVASTEGMRRCTSDFIMTFGEIIRVGFSESTVECVTSTWDDATAVADRMVDQAANSLTWSDDDWVDHAVAIEIAMAELDEVVMGCMSEDEVPIHEELTDWWDELLNFGVAPTEVVEA